MSRKPVHASTRAFRGEVILREGDHPRDEAFMIHVGRVEVHKRVGGGRRAGDATNELLAAPPGRRRGLGGRFE